MSSNYSPQLIIMWRSPIDGLQSIPGDSKYKDIAAMLVPSTIEANKHSFVKVPPTWPPWRHMQTKNCAYVRARAALCKHWIPSFAVLSELQWLGVWAHSSIPTPTSVAYLKCSCTHCITSLCSLCPSSLVVHLFLDNLLSSEGLISTLYWMRLSWIRFSTARTESSYFSSDKSYRFFWEVKSYNCHPQSFVQRWFTKHTALI